MEKIQRFIDDTLAFMMAGAMLAPCLVFMYVIETGKVALRVAEDALTTPVYAETTYKGESRASASIYTVVNGEVITDIHEEKISTDGSSVSVSIQGGVDGKDGTVGEDGKDGTRGQDGKDGVRGEDGEDGTSGTSSVSVTENKEEITKLVQFIHYLKHLISLLAG